MDTKALNDILDQHLLWLRGSGGKRADLSGVNLSYVNLSGVNLFYTKMNYKQSPAEEKARLRLKSLIPTDEFERYSNFGYCYIEGACFGLMELVGTPKGWYCTIINSPEPLPETDRMIHRILLWRKGPEHFYKIANKQI